VAERRVVIARRVVAFAPLLGLGLAYWLLGPIFDWQDAHWLIARAFLEGRVWIDAPLEATYELVPRDGGGWYSPFPPAPAITLLPFAAFGPWFANTNLLAAISGIVAVWLMWSCLGVLGLDRRVRIALTVGFAVGSELLWVAAWGGQHMYPQSLAAALLLGALRLGLAGQAPVAAGLLVGCAGAARLPVGLAIPLVLFLYPARSWVLVLAGFAVPVTGTALYNVARFGSPLELGYDRIVGVDGHVLEEAWYSEGITSLSYLPRGLYTMLFTGFGFVDDPPWLRPDWAGTSILLTMPILVWLFGARGRLAVVAAATAVVVLLPDLLHGNPGHAQFGYRFILDALPILWLLVGLALRHGLTRPAIAALLLGVAVNTYGTLVLAAGIFD
jgi:hypothetical protein